MLHVLRHPDGFIEARNTDDAEPFVMPEGSVEVSPDDWHAVAVHYLRSPSGHVLDMSARRGGDPLAYILRGFTEVRREEFLRLLAEQERRQHQARDAWIADAEANGGFGGDWDAVGARLENVPPA